MVLSEYAFSRYEDNFPEETLIPAERSSLVEFAKLAYKVGLGVNVALLTGHAIIRKSVLPPTLRTRRHLKSRSKK